MKKVIVALLFVLLSIALFYKNETIRIRVLANSNSSYDQKIKKEIVEVVKNEFKEILKDVKNITDARDKINHNLDNISSKVDNYLLSNNVGYKSKINFGLNYFPAKEYNEKTFEEGYYESVLITLGTGAGDNWWCILFPTICLNEENVKYESFLKNIFEKILK